MWSIILVAAAVHAAATAGVSSRGASGPLHAAWRNLSRVIDPTSAPFHADPSGMKDSTGALQAAIAYAINTQSLLMLPLGVYRVTDTLNVSCFNRANDTVWQGEVLSSAAANTAELRRVATATYSQIVAESGHDHHRPIIYLPKQTPGFSDNLHPRYLVFFLRTNHCRPGQANCTSHGGDRSGPAVQPNGNFNQVLRGIDIHVDSGNGGCIALRHRAAQMSAVEDVDIFMQDGYIGLEGLPGAGGSIANVRIFGGVFGIDARVTQPTSVLTAVELHGQQCAAVVYDGQFGQQTLIGVGVTINVTSASRTGIAFYVPGDALPEPWPEPCVMLPFGAVPDVPPGANPLSNVSMHDSIGEGWVSLVDSVATFGTAPGVSCSLITTYTTTVLNNVFVQGCSAAVRYVGTPKAAGRVADVAMVAATAHRFTRIVESVVGIVSDPTEMGKTYQGETMCPVKNKCWTYEASLYLPQRRPVGSRILRIDPAPQAVPHDLVSRHLWDEFTQPSFQSPTVVNVQEHGCVGDGVTDDTAALQRIFDKAAANSAQYSDSAPLIVFLPVGAYGVSSTLRMPESVPTALVGVAHIFSHIVAISDVFENRSTGPIPVLETGVARVWLHGISVGATMAEEPPYRYPLLWRSQHFSSSWRHTRTRLSPPRRPGHRPTDLFTPLPQVVFAGSCSPP